MEVEQEESIIIGSQRSGEWSGLSVQESCTIEQRESHAD